MIFKLFRGVSFNGAAKAYIKNCFTICTLRVIIIIINRIMINDVGGTKGKQADKITGLKQTDM
jgi:hypothetical protein